MPPPPWPNDGPEVVGVLVPVLPKRLPGCWLLVDAVLPNRPPPPPGWLAPAAPVAEGPNENGDPEVVAPLPPKRPPVPGAEVVVFDAPGAALEPGVPENEKDMFVFMGVGYPRRKP